MVLSDYVALLRKNMHYFLSYKLCTTWVKYCLTKRNQSSPRRFSMHNLIYSSLFIELFSKFTLQFKLITVQVKPKDQPKKFDGMN